MWTLFLKKWCVRRLIIGVYTNKQRNKETNKRYESCRIKVDHEYNQRVKCWYFKAKVCNIFINGRFLRSLKDTFIFLLPDHYAQRFPSLITFTNCSYAVCLTKWKFVEQWMSTLPKLVSGHKMSSESSTGQLLYRTVIGECWNSSKQDLRLTKAISSSPRPVPPRRHIVHWGVYTLHTKTAKKVK